MTTVLESYIADSMDESMQPYIESDEYKEANWEFNKMFREFLQELSPEQQKKLIRLMNARGDLESALAGEALCRGIIHGIELHQDIK